MHWSHAWHSASKSEPCQSDKNRRRTVKGACLSVISDPHCGAVWKAVSHRFILLFFRTLCTTLALVTLPKPGGAKLALPGAGSDTGRLGDFSASWRFFCAAYEISWGRIVPRNSCPKTSRHRVSASRRYTDATQAVEVPQTALQRETRGIMHVIGL